MTPGGALCQTLALSHPDLLGALVLTNCDAFEVFPPSPFDRQLRIFRYPGPGLVMMQGMRIPAMRNGPRGYGALALTRLDHLTKSWVHPYLHDATVRRDLASYARAWQPGALLEVSRGLADLALPTLIVWGSRDDIFSASLAGRLHRTITGSQLCLVHDAGALVALDAPDALVTDIFRFAADHGLVIPS